MKYIMDIFRDGSNRKMRRRVCYSVLELYGEQVVRVFPTEKVAKQFVQARAKAMWKRRSRECRAMKVDDYMREWLVFETVLMFQPRGEATKHN